MIINKDYMAVMRAGKRIDKSLFRKQQESAFIVGGAIFAAIIVMILALIFNK